METPTFKNTCRRAPTDPDKVVGVTENVYCATKPELIPTTNPRIILPRKSGHKLSLISWIMIPTIANMSIYIIRYRPLKCLIRVVNNADPE